MAKLEIIFDIEKDLLDRLKIESDRTGKTFDEIIEAVLLKALGADQVPGNRVLRPTGNGTFHFLCTEGMDRISVKSKIIRFNDNSEVVVRFKQGKKLVITKETTWDQVNAFLDAVMPI